MLLQGLLINGQFPGPQIDSVTNDNIVVNVFNNLDQAFLLSWLVLTVLSVYWLIEIHGVFFNAWRSLHTF